MGAGGTSERSSEPPSQDSERSLLKPCSRRRRQSFDEVASVGEASSPSQGSDASKHKTSCERLLTGARGRIEFALDKGWLLGSLKAELKDAARSIREVELELALTRRTRKPSDAPNPLEELLREDGGSASPCQASGAEEGSRKWLLQTFTHLTEDREEAQVEESESNASPRHCQPRQKERRSTSEAMSIQIFTALQDSKARALLERSGELDFDVLAFAALPCLNNNLLQVLFAHQNSRLGLVSKLEEQGKIGGEAHDFQKKLNRFIAEIEDMYRADNSYHNVFHAADCMMTMEWFLQAPGVAQQVHTIDHLMVMIACAIHDVGHDGRSNLFHTKTMSPIAVMYNDKSVLENMHVSNSFEAMQKDPHLNWFGMLPKAFTCSEDANAPAVNLQNHMRRGLIDLVLGTDMAKHADHQRYMNTLAEEAAETDGATLGGTMHLLECLVHAADISNPCKPRPIMLQWTNRVVQEFWAQGDEEMRLGVEVSPMCDRASGTLAVPKGQLGFIDFVIMPFFTPIAALIPEAKAAKDALEDNRAFWKSMEEKQASISQIFGEGA